MELTLTRHAHTQVEVFCDHCLSHTFELLPLLLPKQRVGALLIEDPLGYGRKLYEALFPLRTLARHALDRIPSRIVLVTLDDDLDALPWEYTYGPEGFLVQEYPFM